jgi:hypothetical protein
VQVVHSDRLSTQIYKEYDVGRGGGEVEELIKLATLTKKFQS